MSDKQPLPSDIELTALDPVFREHPHDRLDRLRAEDPVHPDATLERLFLTRFDDMKAVVADRSLSKDPRKAPDTPRRRAMMGVPPEASNRLCLTWMTPTTSDSGGSCLRRSTSAR